MQILYGARFERQYRKLPEDIKMKAESVEAIFRKNPFDARLRTHKLKGDLKDFHAFSITRSYRIIFDMSDANTARFYDIGDHSVYR